MPRLIPVSVIANDLKQSWPTPPPLPLHGTLVHHNLLPLPLPHIIHRLSPADCCYHLNSWVKIALMRPKCPVQEHRTILRLERCPFGVHRENQKTCVYHSHEFEPIFLAFLQVLGIRLTKNFEIFRSHKKIWASLESGKHERSFHLGKKPNHLLLQRNTILAV